MRRLIFAGVVFLPFSDAQSDWCASSSPLLRMFENGFLMTLIPFLLFRLKAVHISIVFFFKEISFNHVIETTVIHSGD